MAREPIRNRIESSVYKPLCLVIRGAKQNYKAGTHFYFTIAFPSQHHITLNFRKSSFLAICKMSRTLKSDTLPLKSCSLDASTSVPLN